MSKQAQNPMGPQPGETWVHKDGTHVVVCALGYSQCKRYEDEDGNSEYRTEFDPNYVGWWTAEGSSTHYTELDKFITEFKLRPFAQEARDAKLANIKTTLGLISQETQLLEGALKKLGGGPPSTAGESTSTAVALTTEGGVEMADAMKKSVATLRNQVQRNALRVKAETEKMAALMKMNVMAVKAQMEGIQAAALAEATRLAKMVKAAEEVVWTFNLYLGKEETIRQLRDGKPAAKDEKLAIRQLVLFMDEESALNAERGGIDFQAMEQFDDWLLESDEHINQVLPNIRGIVAIKPRRKAKKYSDDAKVDAILNQFNQHTYFLIRNGERVFRVDTDLEVGETLVPRSTEFLELFEKTVTDWSRRGRTTARKEPIRPGDKEYMRAMERAGAKERHYLRVFLFLQGLLDRTTVFHPFEVPRVNVFDMMRQDEHLQFVLDAETGRMLGDGRPSFDDWREQINARLEVGMRVIGFFEASSEYSRDATTRTHPGFMEAPSSEQLHTIVSKEERGRERPARFTFRYPRTDPVYGRRDRYGNRDGDTEPKKRVSTWFEQDDDGWIAFDLATAEDMEYYLRSRQNRYQYEKMFPVLKKAIQLKKQEAKAEAPFRTALVGALMRDHGLSEEAAQKEIGELVHWWKYKNKTHRALLSDDEKASRMILHEYALRNKRAADRAAQSDKHREVVKELLREVPDALAIYHKHYNRFVVFRPENDKRIFVNEQLWTVKQTGAALTEERRWVTTDSRRIARWFLLEGTPQWDQWTHDVDPKKVLTDAEVERVLEEGMAKIRTKFDPEARAKGNELWHDSGGGIPTLVHIATYLRPDKWEYWFWSRKSKIPAVKKLTGAWGAPTLVQATITWTRPEGKEAKASVDFRQENFRRSPFVAPERYDDFLGERNWPEPLWFDQAALDAYLEDHRRYKDAQAPLAGMQKVVAQVVAQVKTAMHDVLAAEVRRKFDTDYGDPDLWEAHLATFEFPDFRPESLEEALPYVVERGVNVVGKSVSKIYAQARKYGWQGKMEPDKWHKRKDTIYLPPMDYVVQPVEEVAVAAGDDDDFDD